jgi:predicted transcriptional regulator of viral defense system
MNTNATKKKDNVAAQLTKLIAAQEVARSRDLAARGITGRQLQRLVAAGQVERLGRGLYRAREAEVSEHHTLLQAALLVPKGVVCLLSALRFHGLSTQSPFEVWLALENKSWRPQTSDVPLRLHYFSGRAFTAGIEEHQLAGVSVKIYGAAKTVADCFKFRHKIGLDVALEALRDYLRLRLPEQYLWHYAEICRVQKVIQPYLEALQ